MNERITNKEMYGFMRESASDRAVLHEKLDNQDTKLDEILENVKATNGRVTSLEKWRSYILGLGTFLTAIVIPIGIVVLRTHL